MPVLGFLELAWLIVGAVWSAKHYQTCKPETAKKALLGKNTENEIIKDYWNLDKVHILLIIFT